MGSRGDHAGHSGNPGFDFRAFEKQACDQGFSNIAGVDEAGRGPLAGPVVAAAVVLPEQCAVEGIRDSKKLTAKRRGELCQQIREHAVAFGVGVVDAGEIDRINILQASLRAMAIAVEKLRPPPDYLLVDGIYPVFLDLPQLAVPKGDARCLSIAAASIVAKVHRDQLMEQYHRDYPAFGFDRHKGYPTRAHRAAIAAHGCCPIHRRTFKGVKEFL